MHRFLFFIIILSFFTSSLYADSKKAERKQVNFSMVISGGVSLGAYEAGYNWAIIKMLSEIKYNSDLAEPNLKSVAGASAGSINALLSAMYWCQDESISLHNSIDDNLFYETWVNLGIEDLLIDGKDSQNKSSLFSRRGLEQKGKKIIEHLNRPIYKKNCEVPLGVAVTKVTPIVENIHGIKIKNQNFSVPLKFKEQNGKGIVVNNILPPSNDFYISIPNIKNDKQKLIKLLFASGAFPGAFQQVKMEYKYKKKRYSSYFIDGGLYDNVPLDLAISLDANASTFFFIDPSNMRKESMSDGKEEAEMIPLGFIKTNLLPLFSSFDIMQTMKLYDAINRNFRGDSDKKLVLSSRYHPLSGKYLGHFGAFLDQNFRIYDYYVGVYDAIYHIAEAFKKYHPKRFNSLTQVEIMDYLQKVIGIDKHTESSSAYKLLLETEFNHSTPKTKDRFSAIYNAFNLKVSDSMRYDNDSFKTFLDKLDMDYLKATKNGFLEYATRDIDNWYKRPLRFIVNRITSIENDLADEYDTHTPLSALVNMGAWASSGVLKEEYGFEFLPLNVPKDKDKEWLRTALKFLPSEIATDTKNGGVSFGYRALYYTDMDILDGFEARGSYVVADKASDFIRVDLDAFTAYDETIKFGAGVSLFGDVEGSFYKKDSAYGFNAYADFMDIFRITYVNRQGINIPNQHAIYFGIENIPSLIYWLNR